jgi:hypothetical protein
MIIIFGLIVIVSLISLAGWKFTEDVNIKKKNAVGNAVASVIVSSILITVIIGGSYKSYLDIRAQYDAVINQYKGAIVMYADYANLDVKKAAFTDFKYQGYQENISKVITDLRKEIVRYNEKLIKKRIMDKNPMFSYLIIAPDKDMKIINIVE